MSSDTFELFTQGGEKLAKQLIQAICADISEDRLTRRQALDRAADAMEQVAAIDEGIADPEPVSRIAARLSEAFDTAGFKPLSGETLREHFEQWRRSGAAVSHTATLPETVALVTSAARAFAVAAEPLFQRSDLKAFIAEARPWEDGFTHEPFASAELVLCTWRGDVTGNPNVCAIVAGPAGYVYLDQISDFDGDRTSALRRVLGREDLDYEALLADLHRLAHAMESVNLASYLLDAPERLSFVLDAGKAGPAVVAMWDGEPIAAARQDDAAALALADSAASETCMAEVLSPPVLADLPGQPPDFGGETLPVPHPA
jgi:hypothetical protein